GAPMPVSMTSFLATLSSNKQNCLLKWITESETDNAYFEIQRSNDGVHFEYRGKVEGNGTISLTKHYEYKDEINGLINVIYYRLKIIDKDGKYTFSKIIALKINGTNTNEQFNVYPNPFYSDIKIELLVARKETGIIRFISFEGKEVLRRNIEVEKGNNIIVLKDLNYLPRGNYILEVSTPSTKMIRKIIK
ncbi:MAG: T9SS type A sorting domain-containing protein, partial [Sphingobacteriales bacterium]|nr:T9SS type A sorting domain-containing protein [Sphingobacteriales bacterium]